MFSCVFHLLNGFQTLRPVTRSLARGTGRIGQVLLNEFDFDLISWLHGSHYHSSKLRSRQRQQNNSKMRYLFSSVFLSVLEEKPSNKVYKNWKGR